MNMFYATQKCLVENSAVYSAVPALTSAFAEFESNINTLEAATEKQVIDITGFAKDKAEAEDAMILMTLAVAGGVRAYAMVIGDSVLMEKMNVTESRLRKHRDSVVAQHSQAIHGEATLVVASLAAVAGLFIALNNRDGDRRLVQAGMRRSALLVGRFGEVAAAVLGKPKRSPRLSVIK